MIPIFYGKINHGRGFNPDTPELYFKYLDNLTDQEVQLTVQKKKKKRSTPENKYYWSVVVKLISDELGYTDEETHEALKWLFLRKSGRIETVISTTELSTVEFEDYLTKIRQWASVELNCFIPLPNECEY